MGDKIIESLPRGVAISWGLEKQPQRGPKREMSIEQIVDTAIAIADKEGLSAVSMNKVASSLGFTPMSLYRYVPSKDDLLLLMQDAVCKVLIPPFDKEKHWRENLRQYFLATVDVFRKHHWFADIPIYGVPIMPNNLQVVDWALRCIRELPLNDFEKMSIVLLISSYARSCGIIQRDMARAVEAGGSHETFTGRAYTKALKQLVTKERFPDLYQVVASGVYTEENTENNNVGDDFDFGLERILDGIEYYINEKG